MVLICLSDDDHAAEIAGHPGFSAGLTDPAVAYIHFSFYPSPVKYQQPPLYLYSYKKMV